MDDQDLIKHRIENIVGKDDITDDGGILDMYSIDNSFIPPTKPLYVVYPKTVEEIQEIIKVANHHKIPVTPRSSGLNNQGATIPSTSGIILDLSKMNKIFFIDEFHRLAKIEPGVTFSQLQKKAREYGYRVCTPLELPSESSVLATYLELVPLYSWPKYGTEFLLNMDLVLPTGELLSTGGAANPIVKKGYIPYNAPTITSKIWFGAQGTLGVVASGLVKLWGNPDEHRKVFFVPFNDLKDSFQLIRKIKWNIRVAEEMIIVNDMDLALIFLEDYEDLEEYQKSLPNWTFIIVLSDTEEAIEAQIPDLYEICKDFDANVYEELPDVDKSSEKILKEIEYPQGWVKWSQYKGARNTLPFFAYQERLPYYNEIVFALAEKYGYPKNEIGCQLLPVEIGRVYYQFSFHRDPKNEEESRKVRELYYDAAKRLIDEGAYFSRPFGPIANIVYQRAGDYHAIIKRFKEAIDPNNIMNPGKLAL